VEKSADSGGGVDGLGGGDGGDGGGGGDAATKTNWASITVGTSVHCCTGSPSELRAACPARWTRSSTHAGGCGCVSWTLTDTGVYWLSHICVVCSLRRMALRNLAETEVTTAPGTPPLSVAAVLFRRYTGSPIVTVMADWSMPVNMFSAMANVDLYDSMRLVLAVASNVVATVA